MTVPEAKEILEKARSINALIDSKLAYKYKLQTLSLKLTVSYDSMRVSGSSEKRPTEQIALLETEIDEAVDALVELRKKISAAIERVENPTYRTLLEYRYLSCMTWEQMAEEMDCTDRSLYYKNKKAIEHFSLYFSIGV